MEVTNSQTCLPSLVTSDTGHICATCREAKLGMSKMSYLKLFFYFFRSLLANIFLWEGGNRIEFVQFNNQTFSFVKDLVPYPFLKSISGKFLSKIATSFCILVILRKKNSTKCLTKKSSLAFRALLFGYRGHTSYQASVILVL